MYNWALKSICLVEKKPIFHKDNKGKKIRYKLQKLKQTKITTFHCSISLSKKKMKLQLHFQHCNLPLLIQLKHKSPIKNSRFPYGKREIYQVASEKRSIVKPLALEILPKSKKLSGSEISKERSNLLVLGAVSVGVVLFLMGFDDKNQALALGPEGPLMEEFWENMRRYGLYALTVSTGVLWAVFQPIYELLKNPISAILILTIMGGSFYIVSQVVSAMVGVTDFSYDYNY